MQNKNRTLKFLFLGFFLFLPLSLQAKTEPVYRALDDLVGEFKSDLRFLSEFSSKTSIVDITVSKNLGQDIQNYVLSKIESLPTQSNLKFRFIQCKSCFALRAEKEGDQIRVSKGVNTKEELMELVGQTGIDSYTEVRVNYSGFSLRLHINVYSLSKSELLWGKTYSTRLVTLGQSKIHLSLAYSQAFGEKNSQPWGGDLFVAERIYGLGSFGISAMYLKGHGYFHDYIFLSPTIELSINDMFNEHFSWGDIRLIFKFGFGFYNKKRNFSGGGGIKIKYGNIIYTSLQWIGTVKESKDFEVSAADEAGEDANEDGVEDIEDEEVIVEIFKKEKFPFTMIFSLGVDFD